MGKFWHENGKDVLDFMQCLSAIVTPLLAYIALTTWKRQLIGANRFSGATRMLVLANRIRDTIIAERGNPATFNFYERLPAHDPANVTAIQNNLGLEKIYLNEQLTVADELESELKSTITSIDGMLGMDIPALASKLTSSLIRWQNALKVRLECIEECSVVRRYDNLVGALSLNPILVLDERPESREYEEELRRASLVVAKAMQPHL